MSTPLLLWVKRLPTKMLLFTVLGSFHEDCDLNQHC